MIEDLDHLDNLSKLINKKEYLYDTSFYKTYKKIVTLFIILVLFFIYFLNKYNNILEKKS